MSAKDHQKSLFHKLPPLPTFEDEQINSRLETQQAPSGEKSLDDLSLELEHELHKSDLFRKEEITYPSVVKKPSLAPKKRKAPKKQKNSAPKSQKGENSFPPTSITEEKLTELIDAEVMQHTKQFEAIDSGISLTDVTPVVTPPPETPRVELDAMHKRQQDYFDTLRARLDHEMRERGEHVKQQALNIGMQKAELVKWEKSLAKKEKRIASHKLEYTKIKSLQKQVEDTGISLKYEQARVGELETRLKTRDEILTKIQALLAKKEKQLHELAKELVARGAVIEQHTSADLDHFAAQEAQIATHFESQLTESHMREPVAPKRKPAKPISEQFSKPLSTNKSAELEKLRMSILTCYDALGRGDVKFASKTYGDATKVYVDFAANFGNDAGIHAELTQLHADISLQMRN